MRGAGDRRIVRTSDEAAVVYRRSPRAWWRPRPPARVGSSRSRALAGRCPGPPHDGLPHRQCKAQAPPGPRAGPRDRTPRVARATNSQAGALIRFRLLSDQVVTLNIHDLQGRRVALLLDHVRRPAGVNEAGLNAEGWLASICAGSRPGVCGWSRRCW